MAGDLPFIRFRRPQDAKEHRVRGVVVPAKGKTSCPASPKKCNQELCILKMILERAGCWQAELTEYEPFSEDETEVPRALSAAEQERWLTNEIRALRVGDVNLQHEVLNVPPKGGKNRYRVRTIPLVSAEVKWALEQLLLRATDLGASAPQHYLFPFRKGRHPYDPTRPMTVSGMKKSWEEVRAASGLTWFRPYDTRHTAITRWAESGMAAATIMSMAGHVSERMMRHYTHVSEMAQRRALAKMIPKIGPKSETGMVISPPFYAGRKLS